MGRFEESIAEAQRALQLDPVSFLTNWTLAYMYFLARQYERAIEQYWQVAELEPDQPVPHSGLARIYSLMGRYDDAVRAHKKAMALWNAPPETVAAKVAALDSTYGESGPEGYWTWHLERLRGQYDRQPAATAKYYAQLGDKDQAFAWLEKAYEKHDGPMFTLKVHPLYDPLRDDPRFKDLLRRMNFPEDETQK
jgi:tetratricopeptide (TPR) repeat protein